jgi:hypothetical protein
MNILRRYFFWTYERGSFHYDVMVTLILLFLFVSPRFIDFKDKPVVAVPLHPSEVLIKEQGTTSQGDQRFVYEIRSDALHGATGDAAVRTAILGVVQPIGGDDVSLQSYVPVLDAKGKVVAYDATVVR